MANVLKVVELAAEGLNVGNSIANGGGILAALALTDELSAMGSFDGPAALAELKAATPEKRAEYLTAFKAKLSLKNKALEAKIEGSADCLDEAVSVGLEGVAVVQHAIAVVDKVKLLLA